MKCEFEVGGYRLKIRGRDGNVRVMGRGSAMQGKRHAARCEGEGTSLFVQVGGVFSKACHAWS